MSPVQGAPSGGAGTRRREPAPGSLRHAAITAVVVLGAPLFIAALAIAGVSVPDNLRSPLIEAGLLTRDANEAMDAQGSTQPDAAAAAGAARDSAATRAARRVERGAGSRTASGRERGGTTQSGSGASGEPVSLPPAGDPEAGTGLGGGPGEEVGADQLPAAGAPGGGGQGGVEGPAAPSPVQDGLQQLDETVDQLDDALGGPPPGESSGGLSGVGGPG